MIVSLNWLSSLLGRPLEAEDVARRLAMLGAPVDAVEPIHQDLGDIVVGLVERVEKHPNADRLSLCYVNDGRQVLEVVCGAPNVAAGRRYPFAPVGATLPGGVRLTARAIRGVRSQGMLCSARELGLGPDHEGILELETDAPPGTRLTDALPVADVRITLDVTANRPDLLGHRGVARELAAVYGVPVKLPVFPGGQSLGLAPVRVDRSGSVSGVEVTVEDLSGAPRYIAAVIRGVRVGPSPAWLAARLLSVGARPINNVVDATNYILYELNQPLHAFDLARLRGHRVIVRRARPGEQFVTLDGVPRRLEPDMTVICDAEGPQALAGIMGGHDSEVTPATTDVLLECAYFDPKRIRATRKALKLDTEASYRFERGTDRLAMPEAVRRAVALIRAVAGGTEPEPPVDICPEPLAPRAIFLRPERASQLLGVPLEATEIERHLSSVGFVVAPKDGRFHVQVPGWRPDVTREVDLIEEVARLKGYDTIPAEVRPFRPSTVPDDPIEPLKARLRRLLAARGLYEVRLLSLVPAGGDDDDTELVRLRNPVSREHAALRRDLMAGLLEAVRRNWALRQRDVRLFEIGSVFYRGAGGQPVEELRLGAVMTGARRPPHWSEGNRVPDYDWWDLEALFEEAAALGAPPGTIQPAGAGWVLHDAGGYQRGWARELEIERPPWAAPVFGFELALGLAARPPVRYRPLPATPPVERDLALVVPEGVRAADIQRVLEAASGPLLEAASLFDEYRSPGLPGRSLAWRLRFRAPDRTLRDEEVDQRLAAVLAALKDQLGVVRREA